MNIFSLILIILSVLYVFLGITVIRLDKRSALNRLFFALNLSFIIWAFAAALQISASVKKMVGVYRPVSPKHFFRV